MTSNTPTPLVTLREVTDDDLPIFFEQQLDPETNKLVAFTRPNPSDRDAFMAHWAKNRARTDVMQRTILADGKVAGNMLYFTDFGDPEVGYYLGREFWGRGVATQALAIFLREIPVRPLYAHVAKANGASVRVLQKCGFVISGEGEEYSSIQGQTVEKYILTLAADTADTADETTGETKAS